MRFLRVSFDFQLSQLKKEDIVALGKSIDGFLSSDVGKLTQMAVFAAFPEMKIVKDVAMPVMRQFIKKVRKTFLCQITSGWIFICCAVLAGRLNLYLGHNAVLTPHFSASKFCRWLRT